MASDITVPRPPSSAIFVSTLGPEKSERKSIRLENLTVLVAKVAFAEFLAVSAAAYTTSLLYFLVVFQGLPPTAAYGSAALFIASLILLVSLGFRHYVMLQTQPRHRFLWSGFGAVALAFSFFLSTLFLLRATENYSRATFFIQLVAVAAAVLGVRAIGYSAIRTAIASGRVQARRIVLIGNKANYAVIKDQLNEAGIQTVRSLPFPAKRKSALNGGETALDGELLRQMIDTCRKLQPDDIVILATAADLPRSARLADALSELPISLHVIPVETGELLGSARLGDLGTLVTIQLLRAPLSAFDRLVKRGFDIAAAAVGLLLLSPLLLVVPMAIKLDSRGPVLFRQTRHGYNNDTIRVFKFRSMTTMEDGHAFRQATKNDPRMTRVGSMIRRTNIDELPQLINVLLGEMSIVGPRPHPVAMNEMFQRHIAPLSRRHNVKPGITGWAQVNGYRGETDTLEKMQRRFECDLYYIDNWSLLLDVKIIMMTLFSKRAYTNAV
jgi:Undecaprenyl-phosphate glucose phosphotransferase